MNDRYKNGIFYKGTLKCTLEEIIDSYNETQNIWDVARIFGIPGQSVHKVLVAVGKMNRRKTFSANDVAKLKSEYLAHREKGTLSMLAKEMGRTKPYLCRQAKNLGLTDCDNKISMKPFADKLSITAKKWISERGHPKGMEGKRHSQAVKEKSSIRSKEMWVDPLSTVNSQDYRQKKSDYMTHKHSLGPSDNQYTRTKFGWYPRDGKGIFMRSTWELNYARYLDFLIKHKEVIAWEYEADTFWFEAIKRGCRSYKPDFKVFLGNGKIEYHEVKGWMDEKSKTKLNRMRIYHPSVVIKLVDENAYNAIKKVSGMIENWGVWLTEKPQ